jgi:hypothetical protein
VRLRGAAGRAAAHRRPHSWLFIPLAGATARKRSQSHFLWICPCIRSYWKSLASRGVAGFSAVAKSRAAVLGWYASAKDDGGAPAARRRRRGADRRRRRLDPCRHGVDEGLRPQHQERARKPPARAPPPPLRDSPRAATVTASCPVRPQPNRATWSARRRSTCCATSAARLPASSPRCTAPRPTASTTRS